jgi:hypothetical protein
MKMAASGLLRHIVWYKFTDDSEVLPASIIKAVIALMMVLIILMREAASTSESSINFYQTTWHNNRENSHLQGYLSYHAVINMIFLYCKPVTKLAYFVL